MLRRYVHWPCIRIAELHLIYAEALCQSSRGSMDKAIAQVDIVRARVGMKGLAECNPDKNLQSNKDAFIEELLRERACELGMEDARFFDLIRYKRADIFENNCMDFSFIVWMTTEYEEICLGVETMKGRWLIRPILNMKNLN